jgi:uncharacterized membrane protein HdeD (DUF308 family)
MTAPATVTEVLVDWENNWWAIGLRGLVALLLGILAITMPGPTLAAIVLAFAIYAIVDGILAIIAAVRGIRRKERWVPMLIEGILGIAAGIIAAVWPAIGAVALTYLVAAWALVTGVFEIAAAIRLRKIIKGEWLLLIAGILSVILAFVLTIYPGAGMLTLVWWFGAYAIAYGVINLGLGFRVRSWTSSTAAGS